MVQVKYAHSMVQKVCTHYITGTGNVFIFKDKQMVIKNT